MLKRLVFMEINEEYNNKDKDLFVSAPNECQGTVYFRTLENYYYYYCFVFIYISEDKALHW